MIAGLATRLRDRKRLPGWVNKLIDAIADSPGSPIGRLASRRFGRPTPGTPVTTFPPSSRKLLIAPVNYSGQGREWARAIEAADPDTAVRNMAIDVPGGFSYPADLVVPVPVYHNDRDWQRRQFEAVATTATHVLVEAEEPPFGRLLDRDVGKQVTALLDRGVDVAFVAHGTDIRLPSRHRGLTPWSHFNDPGVYAPRLETLARRNRDLLARFQRPVFVSTPDLLLDVEWGTWCPVVVDPDRWAAPPSERRTSGPLRVAHAPSVATLKGTPLIMPTLEKLRDEGVIEYDLITGVPTAEMPLRYRQADVVLDQFRAGSYGVAACEAMAAGCAVIGHVADEVRELVHSATGYDLPVVEATPDTLETVLRQLAEGDDQLTATRHDGDHFVRTVHDGRLSASVLLDNWLSPSSN